MWIRSQGKHTLINCEVFQVFDDKKTNIWYIKAINVQCERILGRYSTEEKALKVLSMIEEIIDQQEEFKAQGEERKDNNSYRRMIKFVFQMPQDDEV